MKLKFRRTSSETLKIIFVSEVFSVISRPIYDHVRQNLLSQRKTVYAIRHKKYHHG